MISIFQYEDFKSFLKDEFDRRIQRNKQYGLRAFARDLNTSFSRLSEVLSKDEGISITTAVKMAQSLKMSNIEKEYFINLVVSQYGRTAGSRERALKKVKAFKAKRHFVSLRDNYNGILSNWYYLPLMEVLTLKKVKSNLNQIANFFEISEDEVAAAISHLKEMGYIEAGGSGYWKKSVPFLKIESPTPSKSIRDFHLNLLKYAAKALNQQPINKRKYLSTTFTVRLESIEEMRQELEQFNQQFLDKYVAAEDASDGVYSLSMQLYQFELGRG